MRLGFDEPWVLENRTLLMQFLIETVALSGLGGLLGIVGGVSLRACV